MSPQSGLPHNNRTGDLDVFAALFVMKKRGLSIDEMASALACESGLAGISGTSGDIRDIQKSAAEGNARARLALDVLVHSVRHYLGAFLLELGGLDALTFSGGIGENCPEIRAAICRKLESFGIELDSDRNAAASGPARISADRSAVSVLVIPADEERIVAKAAQEVVTAHSVAAGGGDV
jgi:acetate kinase